MGPWSYARHLVSGPRLPFTAAYFGSIALTLYFAIGVCPFSLSFSVIYLVWFFHLVVGFWFRPFESAVAHLHHLPVLVHPPLIAACPVIFLARRLHCASGGMKRAKGRGNLASRESFLQYDVTTPVTSDRSKVIPFVWQGQYLDDRSRQVGSDPRPALLNDITWPSSRATLSEPCVTEARQQQKRSTASYDSHKAGPLLS